MSIGKTSAVASYKRRAETADGSSVLGDYADDLTMAFGRREASVLLLVDQAEELLQDTVSHESLQFLTVLKRARRGPAVASSRSLTLRSDFLGTFQNHPTLEGVAFADVTLGPLPVARFSDVIAVPAACAEIELEPGLVSAMIAACKARMLCRYWRLRFENCTSVAMNGRNLHSPFIAMNLAASTESWARSSPASNPRLHGHPRQPTRAPHLLEARPRERRGPIHPLTRAG